MDLDEEDFVFYGTPIEREEELTSRKKKAVAEASGQLRTLVPWKQEVRDEEGRRRFHGAFTGGFSAGYYNTVGSKEGWTPQAFTSSRKNRAEVKQQNILNFLDDDEKAELEGRSLATSSQFDTFGFTAAEVARKQAEKEQQQRPSVIPGPVPDEIVIPAAESIGVKLLLKMGWRHGHSIKNSRDNSLNDARREARRAFLAFSSDDTKAKYGDTELDEDDLKSNLHRPVNDDDKSSRSTPVYVLNPKQDLYGLGYDPYKHAPEFREKKKSRLSGNQASGNRKALSFKESLFGFKSGKAAPGFGIGALEEYDVEDEDVYGTAYDFEDAQVQEDEEPSRPIADHKKKLKWKDSGVLPGFKVTSNADYQLERFNPPVIPEDFVPRHTFVAPLDVENKNSFPPPPEVPPPEDNNLKLLIEGVASLVARCGKLFEDLSREKNQSNPLFSFLTGGNGHDYYARKLWEEQQKRNDQKKLALDGKSSQMVEKMTAESRGKILGERPLDRSSRDLSSSTGSADVNLQFNLSDTFTKPESFSELPVAKPFKDDPAKQERFEQFLKEKYKGGLRSTDSGGNSNMSEAARARERLDFEAAAEAIEKGKLSNENKPFSQQLMEFSAGGGMQFTSGGIEQGEDGQTDGLAMKESYPKRQEFQWRPSPILCKRFDLIDPFMGKPPPPPRIRSKMDSLIFTSDSVKPTKVEQAIGENRSEQLVQQSVLQGVNSDVVSRETEVEVQIENVERPVDLYKAIFSDDEDDEEEDSTVKKMEDPQKKGEVAHSTLNRLMAGDFLESLGKELGIEVPPDIPFPVNNNTKPSAPLKENAIAGASNVNIPPVEGNSFSSSDVHFVTSSELEVIHRQDKVKGDEFHTNKPIQGSALSGSGKYKDKDHATYENKSGKAYTEKEAEENRKAKSPSARLQESSSSSSEEDERRQKHSKRHRYRSRDSYRNSYSDSSSDQQNRYRSRSEGRKKRHSQDQKSSKRHSKRRKDGSRDSPGRTSHHGAKRGHSESKTEKRRRRD